jgi:hypothetical protein
MAQRLEYVRKELAQVETVAEFWRSLGGEEGTGVGYGSARYYHVDREASVGYLTAVARTYGVNLNWLVLGSGVPRLNTIPTPLAINPASINLWSRLAVLDEEGLNRYIEDYCDRNNASGTALAMEVFMIRIIHVAAKAGVQRYPSLQHSAADLLGKLGSRFRGAGIEVTTTDLSLIAEHHLNLTAAAGMPSEAMALSYLHTRAAAAWLAITTNPDA